MTPQEQQMLDGLIIRIQGTQLAGKDNEAEGRIVQALGGNPDALYILCQTVLVQGYALEQAQRKLQEVPQQAVQQQPSFLEKIFGSSHDTPQANQPQGQVQTQPPAGGYGAPVYAGSSNPPQYAPGYGYGQPNYGQPNYPQAGYGQPAYGAPQQGGGFGGGFLQGALQTAAGVAMGEIAVQSIEGLMHGFGHAAGYGSDRALGGFSDDSSRNFAGSDRDSGDNFGDRLQSADNAGPGLSNDIEDRRGGGSGFLDDGTNTGSQSFDDGGFGAGSGNADNFGNDDSFGDDASGNADSFDSGDSGNDFSGSDDNS